MMAGMGAPRLAIGKILNHLEWGVIRVHDRHSCDQERQEALNAWGARLSCMVSDPELVEMEGGEKQRNDYFSRPGRNRQRDGKVCEQSRGIRAEVRIACIREACRPLPDSSLVSGLQN